MGCPKAVHPLNRPVTRLSVADRMNPVSVSNEILLIVLLQLHLPKQTGSMSRDFWLKNENDLPLDFITYISGTSFGASQLIAVSFDDAIPADGESNPRMRIVDRSINPHLSGTRWQEHRMAFFPNRNSSGKNANLNL